MKSVQTRSFFWSLFYCIRTEYGDLQRKCRYSVWMQENTDQKKLHIWTLVRQCLLKVIWRIVSCLLNNIKYNTKLNPNFCTFIHHPPSALCYFQNVFFREMVKPWFFETFNIIVSHILPENLIEIPQLVQKIWNLFFNINYFHQFFEFSDISLLQRNFINVSI